MFGVFGRNDDDSRGDCGRSPNIGRQIVMIGGVLPVAVQNVGGPGPGRWSEGRLMVDRGRFLGLTAGVASAAVPLNSSKTTRPLDSKERIRRSCGVIHTPGIAQSGTGYWSSTCDAVQL